MLASRRGWGRLIGRRLLRLRRILGGGGRGLLGRPWGLCFGLVYYLMGGGGRTWL